MTSDSTSFVDKPGASVCTSTSGGANSGKTSSGVVRRILPAPTASNTASAATTIRFRREIATSQRMTLVPRAEFGAEELGGTRGHDVRTFADSPRDHGPLARVAGNLDTAARVGVPAKILIDPGITMDVVEHRR